MLSFSDMYTALNVSGVTSTVGTFNSESAVWANTLIPELYAGDGINFYLSDAHDARMDIEIYTYIINCRSSNENQSHVIANAVLTAVNRKSFTDYYISCTVTGTIPPSDETDDFNTIVNATLKKR